MVFSTCSDIKRNREGLVHVNALFFMMARPSPQCVKSTQPLVLQPVPLSCNPNATSLFCLIEMLSWLLHDQQVQCNRPSPSFNPPFQNQRPHNMIVSVIAEVTDSTNTHCVQDHLCFSCFSRDHASKTAPDASTLSVPFPVPHTAFNGQ